MALEVDDLKAAQGKKYTEFSKAVKQELKGKLANHKVTKQYVSDFDKIEQMKKSFEQIKNLAGTEDKEPEDTKDTTEPEDTKDPEE